MELDRMISPRHTATFIVVIAAAPLLAVLGLSTPARAQASGSAAIILDGGTRATLLAERARVRADLDRVNGEIDALKQAGAKSGLGMRDDYRLRARLADAEALARSLTAIDTRLGGSGGTSGATAATASRAPLAAEPRLSPGDGPSEMEAKADILADQARRVGGQAEALHHRAQQIKARQDLRRRVGQMEHDPFSPLEGSKRRIVATAAPSTSGLGGGARDVAAPGSTASQGTTNSNPPATDRGAGGTVSAPTGLVAVPMGSRALAAPAMVPTPTGGAATGDTGALSVQLRDLLDPTTLAEIRRLETSSAPGAGVEALERAASALQARAERLLGQSQTLRAQARAPH
jgi:hypothetical protein